MAKRGRPRKIASPAAMAKAWEAYKEKCDHYTVPVCEFSAKNSEFVEDRVKKRISYTIEGFCVFLGLSRVNFHETYAKDPAFHNIVTRIREECEVDVRAKFETGTIPPQLAALWMSKFGYTTKAETTSGTNNELLQSLLDLERGGG